MKPYPTKTTKSPIYFDIKNQPFAKEGNEIAQAEAPHKKSPNFGMMVRPEEEIQLTT